MTSNNDTTFMIPCGGLYNLTVSSNTTVMDGWYCGGAARDNTLRNQTINGGGLPSFSSISCGDGSNLDINGTTTIMDGYLCGLSRNQTEEALSRKNAAVSYRSANWKVIFALFVCLSLATI